MIHAIDGGLFAECFTAWVEGLRDPTVSAVTLKILAIDGKTSRRTHGSRFETTDGDHGHIAVRRHAVSHDVAWLATDRRFPGEPRFPDLCAIAMVEAEVERDAAVGIERRYDLSSMPLDARLFAHAVRCRRHIENRLHWVLDVVFHEDLSRLRTGAGPQNMATVRHMAINPLRTPRDKHSLKVRRKSVA